jgi:hypothetical protein
LRPTRFLYASRPEYISLERTRGKLSVKPKPLQPRRSTQPVGRMVQFKIRYIKSPPTPWSAFSRKSKKRPNGCWHWIGASGANGYGTFKGHSKVMLPHRFAYEETNGVRLNTSQHVRHKCDSPLCVNPEHLTLGDPKSNALDRWKRTGRAVAGEKVLRRANSSRSAISDRGPNIGGAKDFRIVQRWCRLTPRWGTRVGDRVLSSTAASAALSSTVRHPTRRLEQYAPLQNTHFSPVLVTTALQGCAIAPTAEQQREQARFQQTIPTCRDDRDCKVKWEAAQLWIVHNASYKIQTATDVLLETYNSTDQDTGYRGASNKGAPRRGLSIRSREDLVREHVLVQSNA